jgi:hypothetical protein
MRLADCACLVLLLAACADEAGDDPRDACEAARARYNEAVAGAGSPAAEEARRALDAACLPVLEDPTAPRPGAPEPPPPPG